MPVPATSMAMTVSASGHPDYSGNFCATVKAHDGDTVTIRFYEMRDNDAAVSTNAVSTLYLRVAEHHPVYRSASLPVRQSLSGMLTQLPALIAQSGQIQHHLFKERVWVSV